MKKWFSANKEIILKSIYSLPICFAIIISIFHCIEWFAISNPSIFAIAMSVALEVAAATTLIALLTGKMTFSIVLTFIFVTIYQMLGNIFFSFSFIDESGELFTTWVKFMNIVLGEDNQWAAEIHKFWLSVLSGAVVPGLSLLSLHLIATFELKQKKQEEQPVEEPQIENLPEVIVEKKQPVETKKEVPVVEFPIAIEKEEVAEKPVEEEVVPPIEVEVEKPVEAKVDKPVEVKKETPKRNKSKIVLGNPKPQQTNFVKSTKPAVVEIPQPIQEETNIETESEKTIKKVKLPGFKK